MGLGNQMWGILGEVSSKETAIWDGREWQQQQTYVWPCDLRTLHITVITKYQIIIVYTFYYQKNYVGLLFTEEGAS